MGLALICIEEENDSGGGTANQLTTFTLFFGQVVQFTDVKARAASFPSLITIVSQARKPHFSYGLLPARCLASRQIFCLNFHVLNCKVNRRKVTLLTLLT